MDVSLLIRQKLEELSLDQKDLALAAGVTESYISQLLARKKLPPAPARSEIYEKIESFLKFPDGELTRLAEVQRLLELKRRAGAAPQPLNERKREVLLSKCSDANREDLKRIFDKDAFGEVERLITQTIDSLLRRDEDIETGLRSWHLDLKTFSLNLVLSGGKKHFQFIEITDNRIEPGFEQFRRDKSLSGDITEEEFDFLKGLRFQNRRPTAIYYYRALQILRDPLHFKESSSQ